MSKVRCVSEPGSGPRTRHQAKREQLFKEVKLKKRNELSIDVELKCQELSSLMIEEVDVSIRRKGFLEWSKVFESFLEAQDDYEKYCTEEDRLEDKTGAQTKDYCTKFKEKLQNWILEGEAQIEPEIRPEDSVSQIRRSSRSICSVRSSVNDQIVKAQLEVQSEILKERHAVQQKKLELQFQEEQLNLREKIAEVEARSRVIESSISYKKKSKLKDKSTIIDVKAEKSKEKTVLSSDEVMLNIIREMKKPDSEIDKFDGNFKDYRRFIRQFKTKIESNTADFDERMTYLEQYTTGQAHSIVVGFSHLDAKIGYEKAKKELEDRWGDSEAIAQNYMDTVLEWPNIKPDYVKLLDKYAICLADCENAVESIDAMKVLEFPKTLQQLVQKLPYNMHEKWRNIRYEKKEKGIPIKFHDLVNFVKKEAKKANDPTFGKLAMSSNSPSFQTNKYSKQFKPRTASATTNSTIPEERSQNHKSTNTYQKSNNTYQKQSLSTPAAQYSNQNHKPQSQNVKAEQEKSSSTAISKGCLFCNDVLHTIAHCRKLDEKPINEKLLLVRNMSICFGCLKQGHQRKVCTNISKCTLCQGKHPTLLHTNLPSTSSNIRDQSNNVAGCNCPEELLSHMGVGVGEGECTLAIVLVKVRIPNSEKFIFTYAFLDSGSNVSFVSSDLLKRLGVSGKKKILTLNTMGQPYTYNTEIVKGLIIGDIHESKTIALPLLYSKDDMPVSRNHIPKKRDICQWDHLKDIDIPESQADIGLLLGNNIADAYSPLQVITGPPGSPHATRTRLGWVLWNVVRKDTSNTHSSLVVNRAEVKVLEEIEVLNRIDKAVRNSYEIDFPERAADEKKELSREDKRFLYMVEEATKFQNGHYVVPLPFKSPYPIVTDNRSQVLSRLYGVRSKMLKSQKFYEDYKTFMDGIIEKGFAVKVENDEINSEESQNRRWYLPHHGIYHPRKPDKLSTVFDCSAKSYGQSLNDLLLQGPDLTHSIIGVLLRFRQELFCFMADIDCMFYEVKLPRDQQDYLRFYWWPYADLSKEPEVFRMTVHTFGAVSSPSCANYALKRIAYDNKDNCSAEVYKTILKNFYVDDCLKSLKSPEEVISLCHDLRDFLSKSGFKLRKWVSNCRKLLESLPVEDRAKDVQNIDLEYDVLPAERALGVHWSVETDNFGFRINIKNHTNTRRNILSIVSSIYDPLGFVAPLILPAKILLQDLCRSGQGWDQEIEPRQVKRWQNWLSDLPSLETVQISRCFKTAEFSDVFSCELHNFSDASEKGYGTVSYLCFENNSGKVQVSLVMSKSRVAPLRAMTIPRMELTAALMSVKLSKVIMLELEISIDKVYYWTDSMSVINYIANESTRFHTFVSNRVSAIRANTEVNQWNYIEGKLNPSDLSSRGTTVKKLVESRWFEGPSFLRMPESEWQKSSPKVELFENDPEVKAVSNVIVPDSSSIEKFIEYFSSWNKLRRMVGWLLQFVKFIKFLVDKKKVFRSELESTVPINQLTELIDKKINGIKKSDEWKQFSQLDLDSLQEAESCILKIEQKRWFSEELKVLDSQQSLKMKSSRINRLDPVLVSGLIRVGGRLNRSSLQDKVKHPVILPKQSHVSSLLVQDAHKSVGHVGRNATIMELRHKYWILQVNSIVRRTIRNCLICRIYQSRVGSQKMADLPIERLIPDEPPFSRTGVDYFGPFYVKVGRSNVKRYGVLFTCLATRAIHLEVAHFLDTNSCINALRRFVSRRGCVKYIRSDNGTNLVGSEKELRDELNKWNSKQIHDYLLQKNIVWNFNPPTGSHFGGVWERQIRSVRKVLYAVIKETTPHTLDDESLLTVFCEVERIVNSRPVTSLSDNPNDFEAITPNHLLQLQPNYSFPPGIFDKKDAYFKRRWKQVQFIANTFWDRWLTEYLPSLQERKKWTEIERNLKESDLVLLVDDSQPRGTWLMGRIVETFPDSKGYVRSVKVKTKYSTLIRPISKLCLIVES